MGAKIKQDSERLYYRNFPIRAEAGAPKTFNQENRSLEVVCTTEALTQVYDYERMAVVNEVLLMSGAKLPPSKQIPLLDSHDRYSVKSILGSARELAISGDKLISKVVFSSDPESENVMIKVAEGHATDYSVGY